MKRQLTYGWKCFSNHVSDKDFISWINKELLQQQQQQQKDQKLDFKNRQRIWMDFLQKKVYEWQTSTIIKNREENDRIDILERPKFIC